ncbi:MAG: SpoIID/LytB domain-containing protein [Bacteroidales bacterium]|nr:SpoIID/LytB domain-containing protein [Candidatus Colimorpha onthohippi]
MKRLTSIALLLIAITPVMAEHVSVRLFSANIIKRINISFDLGAYDIIADDTLQIDTNLTQGQSVELVDNAGNVNISINGYNYGTHKTVRFQAVDTACILCLNPQGTKSRTYEGNLIVKSKGNQLVIINDVAFETYIAGVVQSEIYGKESDIYRVQAIISRTWALRNINKHEADGYNFCDHVHCQAYLNRCTRPEIILGVMKSTGQTIVDSLGNLIETPFHSNSGGQTANSEDVWRSAMPYLRSVVDTFSLQMKQANWTKTMSEKKWLDYFAKKHHIIITDSANRDTLLHFTQRHRQSKLLGIPLTKIRTDLGLKSTFFSIEYDSINHNVLINGHGYGHGVGLSQEGAIRMVRLGIAYDSIIRHYYTGAHIATPDSTHLDNMSQYIQQLSQIIQEDKQQATRKKSAQDDWLGRLFRIRDRQEREEVYDPHKQDLESDWQYDW